MINLKVPSYRCPIRLGRAGERIIFGADRENRTLKFWVEAKGFTIKLYPQLIIVYYLGCHLTNRQKFIFIWLAICKTYEKNIITKLIQIGLAISKMSKK